MWNVQSSYKKLEDTSPDDIALLHQAFIRLRAEGIILHDYKIGELLDAIFERGDYKYDNKDLDSLVYQDMI